MSPSLEIPRPALTRTERIFFAGIGIVSSPVIIGYVLSMLLGNPSCPANTFWSGYELQTVALLVGLFACFMAVGLVLTVFGPLFISIKTLSSYSLISRVSQHKVRTLYLAIACGFIAGISWHIGHSSSFCLDPDKVTIHTPFSGDQVHPWAETRAVEADCSIAKSGRYADFLVSFSSGHSLSLSFQNEHSEAFEALRVALSRVGYFYRVSSSVTAKSCPPGLYPLLMNWGRPS